MRGRYIRRAKELKAEALSLKPDLSPPMVRLYISIQSNLIALDGWAEGHAFVNSRGQAARFAEEQDRQRGRFLEWCRLTGVRADGSKPASTPDYGWPDPMENPFVRDGHG